MRNLNILQAEDLIDNELNEKQIDLLRQVRGGVALSEVDDDMFRDLYEGGYVKVVYFTHIAASTGIQGVILSDDGVKLMTVLDNREKPTIDEKIEITENAIVNEQSGTLPETYDQTLPNADTPVEAAKKSKAGKAKDDN